MAATACSRSTWATAAVCRATFEALSDARSAVNQNKVTLRVAVIAKNKALKKLRQKMRGLIQELHILLSDTDPRWLQFHLQMPTRLPMPEPVERVTLETTGAGKVFAQWPPAPHAKRYRVQWRQQNAAEFRNAATVPEPEALLKDLPSGESIEVRVIAANKTGEAAPSPTAVVMVGVTCKLSLRQTCDYPSFHKHSRASQRSQSRIAIPKPK